MKRNTIIAAVVGAVIFAGGGFYGGYVYAKTAVPSRAAFAQGQFATAAGGFAGRMGSARGGGLVAGEILSKDATSLTVKLQDGSTKIVLLSASTTVSQMTVGSVGSLTTGSNVAVTGTANQDGSLTAMMIQVRPAVRQQ